MKPINTGNLPDENFKKTALHYQSYLALDRVLFKEKEKLFLISILPFFRLIFMVRILQHFIILFLNQFSFPIPDISKFKPYIDTKQVWTLKVLFIVEEKTIYYPDFEEIKKNSMKISEE